MNPSRKQLGCCTLCGREVFEVAGRWPHGHALAGEPRRLGRPLASARRATLWLCSGAQASVTLCDRCKLPPQDLDRLWTICVTANAQQLEDDRREALGSSALEGELGAKVTESVRRLVADLPLFVLSIVKWEDLLDDEPGTT